MKSYTEKERNEHIENWKNGTLSKAAYAKSAGIVTTTFYKWAQETKKRKKGFVEIRKKKILGTVQEIIIEKGNLTIRLPLSAGAEGLRTVVSAFGEEQ